MDALTPDIRISKSDRSFSPVQNSMPKMANKPWNAATYVFRFRFKYLINVKIITYLLSI